MSNRVSEWLSRVKGVEREYRVSYFALDQYSEDVRKDTSILDNRLEVKDLMRSQENLEGTYIIRIFAEFETCLRKYWNRNRPLEHNKKTPAELLVDRVGTDIHVSQNVIEKVHRVRDLRNYLVHDREENSEILGMGEVSRRLCCYLYCLHGKWD